MWSVRSEPAEQGLKYTLIDEAERLSFRQVLDLLESSDRFASWYAEQLAAAPFAAFFWEHPSLTTEDLDDQYEVVLLPAEALARARPDELAFREHYQTDAKVVVFDNLGGDASLVVPTPHGDSSSYTHLAAFVRSAPNEQVIRFWRAVATAAKSRIRTKPKWLSTAGLGVFWLHVRIDSRPKYYRYRPYRQAKET